MNRRLLVSSHRRWTEQGLFHPERAIVIAQIHRHIGTESSIPRVKRPSGDLASQYNFRFSNLRLRADDVNIVAFAGLYAILMDELYGRDVDVHRPAFYLHVEMHARQCTAQGYFADGGNRP